jgi:hypothetical protein
VLVRLPAERAGWLGLPARQEKHEATSQKNVFASSHVLACPRAAALL